MKTPKEFTQNLEERIITKEMLGACAFSVNKRAKNMRDEQLKYANKRRSNRFYYDKYNNEMKYRIKKENYYAIKEELLSLAVPVCIHMEKLQRKERIYDYEREFSEYTKEDIIYSNEYYDKELEEYVTFIDVINVLKKYYLFYDFEKYSFHVPIEQPEKFPDLEIVEISQLLTYGKNIENLVPVQFVDKVIVLIRSGDYTYVG